jgi:hypothetical protein
MKRTGEAGIPGTKCPQPHSTDRGNLRSDHMSKQLPPVTRHTVIVLDLAHVGKALEIAKKFAEATGQTIMVKDLEGVEIDTIRPTRH